MGGQIFRTHVWCMCQRMATCVVRCTLMHQVKILDRYVIREVLLPTLLVLVVLTFVLMIPTILREAEAFIAKGVAWSIIGCVLLTLLPSSLGITIPVALLAGILIAFGKLSADREFVAMQACGVSIYRLLRPVAVVAVVATAADAYAMIVALPKANQTFREIAFNVMAGRVESDINPRVFFDDFPNRVIYVRDVVPGGLRDVFMADSTRADQTTVFFAEEGRLIINHDTLGVTLELKNGTRHTIQTTKPEEYEGGPVRVHVAATRRRNCVPPDRPREGRARNERRRASRQHRRGSETRRAWIQPAVHDPTEVFISRRLPRSRAAGPWSRGQQPQGRKSGQLRHRDWLDLHLLRRVVGSARVGDGRPAVAGTGPLGAEHLFWRDGRGVVVLAIAVGRSARCPSAFRRSGDARKRRPPSAPPGCRRRARDRTGLFCSLGYRTWICLGHDYSTCT